MCWAPRLGAKSALNHPCLCFPTQAPPSTGSPSASGPRDETPGDFPRVLASLFFSLWVLSSLLSCPVLSTSFQLPRWLVKFPLTRTHTRAPTRAHLCSQTHVPSAFAPSLPPFTPSPPRCEHTQGTRPSPPRACTHTARSHTLRHPQTHARPVGVPRRAHSDARWYTRAHTRRFSHRHTLGPCWRPFAKNFPVTSERKSSNENQIR